MRRAGFMPVLSSIVTAMVGLFVCALFYQSREREEEERRSTVVVGVVVVLEEDGRVGEGGEERRTFPRASRRRAYYWEGRAVVGREVTEEEIGRDGVPVVSPLLLVPGVVGP